MDKIIKSLRTFFRISNAAFDMANIVKEEFGGTVIPNKMHELHKIALEEIEKETPDLSIIDNLLAKMEKLAEANSQPLPKFPKGTNN